MMKKNKHDFYSLTAEIFKANVHDVGSKPAVLYCIEYPQAIAQAIEQREYVGLMKLLDAQEPIHPCLGPALAAAFRAQEQGKVPGNRPKLSSVEKDAMISTMKQMYFHGQKAEEIREKISTGWQVNIATVKRVWDEIPDKSKMRCILSGCLICKRFSEMPR